MPEQHQRQSVLSQRREADFYVVQVIAPAPNVDASTARESVPAQIEGVYIQSRLGHEPAGSLISAAVLTDAVDDQDASPGRARGRPLSYVQRRPVGRRPLGSGRNGHFLGSRHGCGVRRNRHCPSSLDTQ